MVPHQTVGLLTPRCLFLGRSPVQRRARFEEACACGVCLMSLSEIHRTLEKLLKELHWRTHCQLGLKGTGSGKRKEAFGPSGVRRLRKLPSSRQATLQKKREFRGWSQEPRGGARSMEGPGPRTDLLKALPWPLTPESRAHHPPFEQECQRACALICGLCVVGAGDGQRPVCLVERAAG